jgi:hypothetical protein
VFIGAVVVIGMTTSDSNNTSPVDSQRHSVDVPTSTVTEDVQVTDGTRHTIPLDEIIGGGPGKDGIPSIDNPEFVSVADTRSWLPSDAEGIGVTIDGTSRFYPYAILVWHEIVNDQINDKPLTVTYCPLCKTGIVFDPVVNGERFEFGVSGKLWQSNMLMYDRTQNPENESYWSQVLGKAVVGPLAGTELEVMPSTITRLSQWQEAHPDTKVLARPENSRRNYNRDPYEGYYDSSRVSFGAEFDDERLDPKRLVYGIKVGDQFKAYPADNLPTGTTTDTVGTTTVTINQNEGGTVVFKNDSGQQISHVTGFWFSWAAVHPETDIYKSE